MKILHIYKVYIPEDITGVARVIYEISEGMALRGAQTEILANGPPPTRGPIQISRHTVHLVARHLRFASTDFSFSLASRFRQLRDTSDILHFHFPWPVADALYLTLGKDKPALVTYHSDIVRQKALMPVYRPVMEAFLNRMIHIVATSDNYATNSQVLQRFAHKVTTIPIGLPERHPASEQLVDKWRSRLGAGFFLFVGAPRYYKGLGFLIEAARRTGLPVVIAGAENVGRSRIDNVPANVTFVGEVTDDDKEALLSLSLALVLPSHLKSEGFGIVLVEAARASRPMICCEIGTGTSFVNRDGVTGLVVPPADPDAIAAAMRTLATDPGRAATMGMAARSRFETLLRAEDMVSAYHALYAGMMAPLHK